MKYVIPKTSKGIEKKLKQLNASEITTPEEARYVCELSIALIDKSLEELEPHKDNATATMLIDKFDELKKRWFARLDNLQKTEN